LGRTNRHIKHLDHGHPALEMAFTIEIMPPSQNQRILKSEFRE